jgi:hypothetical protein
MEGKHDPLSRLRGQQRLKRFGFTVNLVAALKAKP